MCASSCPPIAPIEDAYHAGQLKLSTPLPGGMLVPTGVGAIPAGVFEGQLPGSDVPVYFIAEGNLFGRPQIYGYGDDVYRFAFFSRAALEFIRAIDWRPDVVNAHDWHAAPAITWLNTAGNSLDWYRDIPSIFTIHNLMHQGKTSWDVFDYLQLVDAPPGPKKATAKSTSWRAASITPRSSTRSVPPMRARS